MSDQYSVSADQQVWVSESVSTRKDGGGISVNVIDLLAAVQRGAYGLCPTFNVIVYSVHRSDESCQMIRPSHTWIQARHRLRQKRYQQTVCARERKRFGTDCVWIRRESLSSPAGECLAHFVVSTHMLWFPAAASGWDGGTLWTSDQIRAGYQNFNTLMVLTELPQYYWVLKHVMNWNLVLNNEGVNLTSISEPKHMQHACCTKI